MHPYTNSMDCVVCKYATWVSRFGEVEIDTRGCATRPSAKTINHSLNFKTSLWTCEVLKGVNSAQLMLLKSPSPGGNLGDPNNFLLLPHLKKETNQNLTYMQEWSPPQAWFPLNIRQHFENIAEIHSETFFPLPQKQGQNSPPQHHGQQMEANISKLWQFFCFSLFRVSAGGKGRENIGGRWKKWGKTQRMVAAENSQRGTKFKEQVTSMWYDVLSWGRDAFCTCIQQCRTMKSIVMLSYRF